MEVGPRRPQDAVFQEEVLGHVGKLLAGQGTALGGNSEEGGDVWEFIVTVPRNECNVDTIEELERLTAS